MSTCIVRDMPDHSRPDLAAMVVPLGRALLAAEQPVLRAHELTMWGYSVLLRLDSRPMRSQASLAETIGADKSRLVDVLDELQRRDLITRTPEPADRRVRLLALTPKGRRLRESVQRAIQQNEQRLLRVLPPAERTAFISALQQVSAAAPDALAE
jgi:DNA-binding MarR family transcriptional regulator